MRKLLIVILKRYYLLLMLLLDALVYIVFVKYKFDIFYIKSLGYGIDPALSTIVTVPMINGLITGFCEDDLREAIILGGIFGGMPIFYWLHWSMKLNIEPYQLFHGWFYHVIFTQICAGYLFGIIGNRINSAIKNLSKSETRRKIDNNNNQTENRKNSPKL